LLGGQCERSTGESTHAMNQTRSPRASPLRMVTLSMSMTTRRRRKVATMASHRKVPTEKDRQTLPQTGEVDPGRADVKARAFAARHANEHKAVSRRQAARKKR
jgi:hypothetical protein